MQFELARASDEPGLRRLLRETPMGSDIRLTLEREPCVDFANTIEGDATEILVARAADHEPPVAMAARTVLTSFVNGAPTRVGYLGQLRIRPEHRRPRVLQRGYAALRGLLADSGVSLNVTTIVSDNIAARRVFEAGLRGLPTYRYLGDILSLTYATGNGRKARGEGLSVEAAQPGDMAEIAELLIRNGSRFQFAPQWTREDLVSSVRARGLRPKDFFVARKASRVIGCLACWDQREFKQVVVRGYSRRAAVVRPLWNALALVARWPQLPPAGAALPLVFLSHVAVDNDDAQVFSALLDAGLDCAHRRGIRHAVLGLAERHPLAAIARARRRPRIYRSRAYLVYWPEGEAAAQQVDGRPLHLEVAIL
jgi:hypothetical protein